MGASAPEDGGVDKARAHTCCHDATCLVAILKLPGMQDVAQLAASILRKPAASSTTTQPQHGTAWRCSRSGVNSAMSPCGESAAEGGPAPDNGLLCMQAPHTQCAPQTLAACCLIQTRKQQESHKPPPHANTHQPPAPGTILLSTTSKLLHAKWALLLTFTTREPLVIDGSSRPVSRKGLRWLISRHWLV